MTIWRMRIACWIPKATNTHTSSVTLIFQYSTKAPQCYVIRTLLILVSVLVTVLCSVIRKNQDLICVILGFRNEEDDI